jgi:hypothetical protein
LKFAKKTFAGSAFTVGDVFQSVGTNLPTLLSSPRVALGFDPQSDRFVMVSMADGLSNSVPTVYVLTDSMKEAAFPVTVNSADNIQAIGKPVCVESGTPNCSIPITTSPDRGTPYVKYINGYISGNQWVTSSIVNGGYISYGEVDHAYDVIANQFSVSWQSLSGRTLVHKRNTISSSIDTTTEFNTNLLLPAGLGSNMFTLFGANDIRHWVHVVTSW